MNVTAESDTEVHEWGIFVKDYNCTVTAASAGTPILIYVHKPVIYFHNFQNNTKSEVEVSSITNASTEPYSGLLLDDHQQNNYPIADITTNKISWNFTLVNDLIKQNETLYPYLFYEGKITDNVNITATITDDNILSFGKDLQVINNTKNVTYHIKNNEEYTLSNAFLIYGKYSYMGSNRYGVKNKRECINLGNIAPGEENTITDSTTGKIVNSTEMENILLNAMINRGLTQNESQELIDYWYSWWFNPTNNGIFSRLVYMIPESEYNKLLPISITPQPNIIKRVGIYTITDLPIIHEEYIIDISNLTIMTDLEEEYYLDLNLSVDKTLYNQEENISISLKVTNPTDKNIILNFSSSKYYDFKVLNNENEIVYYWSYQRSFDEELTYKIISANETVEYFTDTWNQKDNNGTLLPAGNYTIVASIPTKNEVFSNGVDIQLERKQIEKIQETPGFEILFIIAAVVLTIFLKKRRFN